MSIEFASCFTPARRSAAVQPSIRLREANRRNALRSTGPRTPAGKRRSAQNALKHGLCADTAIPPCEDLPTFRIFLAEIEEELQPTSIMQKILFPQIANLIWRLRRLPEAQADVFQHELQKAADPKSDGETLTPSQILARRFSEDPANGFALLGRYERGLQNMLLRMLREYYSLKKNYPYTPYAYSELQGRPQPGWNEQKLRQQQRNMEATMDRAAAAREDHLRREREEEAREEKTSPVSSLPAPQSAERTQSNPPPNPIGGSESQKYPDFTAAPVTERTQCDPFEKGSKPVQFRCNSGVLEGESQHTARTSDVPSPDV